MTKYMGEHFLLTTKAARELYHGHAEKMPIIDYHCHLPPREIAEDRRWTDIAQVWLGQIVEDISYNNANRYFGFEV